MSDDENRPASVRIWELASDLWWNLLTTYGLAAIGVARTTVLLTFVPVAIYGKLQLVRALTPMMLLATFAGANTSIVQATARGQEHLYHHFQRLRTKLSAIPLVLSLAAAGYYELVESETDLAIAVAGVGLLYPLVVQDLLSAVLVGRREFKTLLRIRWPAELLGSGLVIAVGVLAPSALLWLAVPPVIVTGLAWTLARRAVPVSRREASREDIDAEWTYVKQRSAMALLGFAGSQLDRLVVGTVFGFASLAIYSLAKYASEQLVTFAKAGTTIILQRLSSMSPEHARRQLPRLALLHFSAVCAAAAALDLVVYLYVSLMVPEKFGQSLPFVHLMLPAVALSAPSIAIQNYFASQKLVRWELWLQVVIPIFYVTAMTVLGPIFGVNGFVYAFVAKCVFQTTVALGLYVAHLRTLQGPSAERPDDHTERSEDT